MNDPESLNASQCSENNTAKLLLAKQIPKIM
jgi:hypothetical protein